MFYDFGVNCPFKEDAVYFFGTIFSGGLTHSCCTVAYNDTSDQYIKIMTSIIWRSGILKRTPMLHFCLLTSSLKPVRETCDVRRLLLHNVATEWRQTSAQTLHLSAGSGEPRERKQVGQRGDDISSGKEMTEGERARDRKRERLPKCRCKYCFMFLQRHTHL